MGQILLYPLLRGQPLNVLPFGLSTARYIFTKLLCPLYLDDGLGLEETYEKAEYAAHHTRGDLFAAGFVVAEEKKCLGSHTNHRLAWY